MRLLLACAAYVLHHALRTQTLQQTALAHAQPSTLILTLFKAATQVKQYKDRILLHLPTSCPVKALSLNLLEFVVSRSWHACAAVDLDEAPLFARDWRRNSGAILSASASVYALQ